MLPIVAAALVLAQQPSFDLKAAKASHERMKQALAEVAARRDDHPFLGRRPLVELQARLAALPAGAPLGQRLQAMDMVGYQQLVLGDTRGSIETLQKALDLAAKGGAAVTRERQVLLLHLGTAWLRLGESENCLHCSSGDACIVPIRGAGIHTKQEGSRKALGIYRELLATAPDYAAARWLLTLTAMTLGEWPDGLTESERLPPGVFASDEPFPRFPNIAHEIGLNDEDLSGAAVADDFDGDGLTDLMTTSFDVSAPIKLYRNNGDGTFTERAKAAGLDGIVGGLNAIQGDYDDDGFVDVVVLRGAWCREQGRHPRSLLRNMGDGTFLDVTYMTGLGAGTGPSQTAAFGDYDRDGDLDLYVGAETSQGVDVACQLFRNDGGRFTDVTAQAGVANGRYAKAVVFGDYDDDGWPDLYVSNQNLGEENRLYRNQGDGTFVDVAPKLGVTHPLMSFPAWFFDYDNDGNLDLFCSSYNATAWFDVPSSWLGQPIRSELHALYRNDGKGGFVETGRQLGIDRLSMPMGCNFGDLDNDGWLDFYLGTGAPRYEAASPHEMYRNVRGERFADVSSAGGFSHLQKGHGVAFADFDHDGDQDVFEQLGGAFPGDGAHDVFFENPGLGNHWLKVKLVGTKSSRTPIGARLRVEIEEEGKTRSIYKHVNSGASFGANPLRQELGLGKAARIVALDVRWPATHETETFRDVPLDACIEIVEGSGKWKQLPHTPFKLGRKAP